MCWPNSLTRRYSMNFGPRKMQISIAAIPAIRISPMSGAAPGARRRPEQLAQRGGERLEACRPRALDEHDVAVAELSGEQLGRPPRAADQLVGAVVAGCL